MESDSSEVFFTAPASSRHPVSKRSKQTREVLKEAKPAGAGRTSRRLDPPQLNVVPLNTYDKRWDQLTTVNGKMTEAPSMVQAAQWRRDLDLDCGHSYGYHQAAFPSVLNAGE